MKFSVIRETFLEAAKKTVKVISARSSLPITKMVLVELQKDELKLTATNMDQTIITKLPVNSEDSGKFTLPGKPLVQLLQNLDDIELTIESDGITTSIKTARNTYKFLGQPPEDFPEFTEPEGIELEVKADELNKGLNLVGFCAARRDTRSFLNGVFWDLREGELRLVASDSLRLGLFIKKTETLKLSEPQGLIVPREVQDYIKEIDGEVIRITAGENMLKLTTSEITLLSRLIEGSYVPYESVIPTDYTNSIILDTEELRKALRRILTFAPSGTYLTKLEFGEVLKLSTENPEMGEALEEVPSIAHEGDNGLLGINANYLMEIIKHIETPQVMIKYENEEAPVVINPIGEDIDYSLLYLIMPIRL